MSDLHTLLLIAPPGDTTLLADEVGGKVPTLTWCYSEYTDRNFWARPGPGARPHEGAQAAVGLVLVSGGAPVAMGCDRAARAIGPLTVARVRREGTGVIRAFAPLAEYRIRSEGPGRPYGLLDLCAAWEAEGARVVALSADGREVTP